MSQQRRERGEFSLLSMILSIFHGNKKIYGTKISPEGSGEIITNIRNANPIIVDIVDGEEEVVPFAVMSISG